MDVKYFVRKVEGSSRHRFGANATDVLSALDRYRSLKQGLLGAPPPQGLVYRAADSAWAIGGVARLHGSPYFKGLMWLRVSRRAVLPQVLEQLMGIEDPSLAEVEQDELIHVRWLVFPGEGIIAVENPPKPAAGLTKNSMVQATFAALKFALEGSGVPAFQLVEPYTGAVPRRVFVERFKELARTPNVRIVKVHLKGLEGTEPNENELTIYNPTVKYPHAAGFVASNNTTLSEVVFVAAEGQSISRTPIVRAEMSAAREVESLVYEEDIPGRAQPRRFTMQRKQRSYLVANLPKGYDSMAAADVLVDAIASVNFEPPDGEDD